MQDKRLKARKMNRPITLDMVQSGKKVKVVGLPQGSHSAARLMNLGIGPGVDLEVLTAHPFRGPIVIRLDGNPVAIGYGLARKITVE